MTRPYISRIKIAPWKHRDGTATPGIALRKGKHVTAHLTAQEAIELSNQLTDLAEQMEGTP